MALAHQPSGRLQVSGRQSIRRLHGAGVLRYHMTGPTAGDGIHGLLRRLERLEVGVAERPDPESEGSPLAARPPVVVGRVDQLAAGAGVEDHHRPAGRKGDRLPGQITTIDEEGMTGLAGGAYQLVHDPAVHPHPLVLGPLADARQPDRVGFEAGHRLEGAGGTHLEGGRGGQPGTGGEVADDRSLPSGQTVALLLQLVGDSLQIGAPPTPAPQGIQGELDPVEVGPDPHHAVRTRTEGDPEGAVDGQGQHESLVVVGVLADQVHSPRCSDQMLRRTQEPGPELLDGPLPGGHRPASRSPPR